jgi:hypothetical protein
MESMTAGTPAPGERRPAEQRQDGETPTRGPANRVSPFLCNCQRLRRSHQLVSAAGFSTGFPK